ncbi:MAG TPA: PIN domain-containing protein [Terriglobales bacterium]|nr:PIN domain-containing protein [Terriglobales bacterium]
MRIFLDANVLFSAGRSDGAMRQFLRLLTEDGHELHADTYVAEEARRNLSAKAAGTGDALDENLDQVTVAVFVPGHHPPSTHVLPEKDRPVLAAAIRLKCDVLVTGDRSHFGQLYGKTIDGVTIHSPRSLAESL